MDMNKIISVAMIAIIFLLPGCIKVGQIGNINFNVPYSQQVDVPQVADDSFGTALPAGGISIGLPAVGFATNSGQYLVTYNTSASKITTVDLKSLSLQILAPATQNFDFLDSVQVYISAQDQPKMLVAYQYSVAKGLTTLSMNTVTDVNLKNYFIQDTIYFRINTHVNAIPATGTQLNIASSFHVLANLLN